MARRSTTGGGATNLEQCGWKRQIRERTFLYRGEGEEDMEIVVIFKSPGGDGVKGRDFGSLQKDIFKGFEASVDAVIRML